MASEIRVNSINSRSGLGTVTIADSGIVVSGIVTASNVSIANSITATTFYGSGANLSGIDATALKDSGGNVKVQANTSGIEVTGIATVSSTLDLSQSTTGIALPQGTTAQRPSGNSQYLRWNTTNSALEFYNGTDWVEIISDYFPSGSTILG